MDSEGQAASSRLASEGKRGFHRLQREVSWGTGPGAEEHLAEGQRRREGEDHSAALIDLH